jgi:mycothiol synthase
MHHVEVVTRLEDAHLEQLPELVEAATRADGHEPIGEHKFLRLRRGDDLALGLLAFEHGRLAGYAHTLTYGDGDGRRASCEFVVHPEMRQKGVGRSLLTRAIDEASGQGARRMDLWAYNDSAASARIAGEFGFTPARRLLHLHRHVVSAPYADAPANATLRAFRPGVDDARWLELNNRIFRGHPENGAWTLDDLRARMSQPWFDANDMLVLEIEGALAGFCWLKIEDRGESGRVGEIYVIGTAPECRGLGLGRYLLSRGLAHLRDRGVSFAAIYVDEANAAAVTLYEAAGFHHHHVDVCYTRALAAAVTDGTAAA